jgi:hypothetical protein
MDKFNLKKYLKEGKLNTNEVYSEKQRKWACAQDGPQFDEMCKDTAISKKKKLKEITNYGGEGTYPMSEKPGDIFQQKEVEDLFPNGMDSRSDKAFRDRLKKHADWTEQSGYNNTFVHFQYHETDGLEDDYFIHQKQHYNHNYDDFRTPRFTELYIVKNKDTDREEELGTYIVSTPEYIKDIKALDNKGVLGRPVSEGYGQGAMAVFSSEEDEDKYIEKMVKQTLEKEKDKKKKKVGENKIKTPETKAIATAVQKHFTPQKTRENLDTQATKLEIVWENRAQDLASDYSLEELNDFLQRLYGEMEQEAEPEGGPIADQYADEIYQYEEAIRIKKGVGQRGRKDLTYDQAIGREDITDETGTYTIRPDGTKDYKRIAVMSRDEFEKSSKFDRNLKEAYEIGDEVILRGNYTDTDVLKVVGIRRMFGSNLMAYEVEFPNGEVAEYDETQLSLNPGFVQDLETRADDYFSEPLKEFVGGELEKRNQVLYDELVPGMGKADTQEGEMLRAINRIVYRYYNDGDEYMRGYGTETAGPAHSFLINANTGVRSAMQKIFSTGTDYEETIEDALEHIVSHIEAKQGKYTPNSEDMFSYKAEFEDDEDYDDEYEDDYYDEEDEYYQ